MNKEIRRLNAQKAIENYLRYFLPQIGLGNLVSFKCNSFNLGDYTVETSGKTYYLTFSECMLGGKKFYIVLNNNIDTVETIGFSISGFLWFNIYVESVMFETSEGTYITDLTNDGYTTLCKNEAHKDQYFQLNELTKLPKHVNLHRLLQISKDEWI